MKNHTINGARERFIVQGLEELKNLLKKNWGRVLCNVEIEKLMIKNRFSRV